MERKYKQIWYFNVSIVSFIEYILCIRVYVVHSGHARIVYNVKYASKQFPVCTLVKERFGHFHLWNEGPRDL